jgi:hypothetical protein
VPTDGAHETVGTAWAFLLVLALAFATYVVGVALVRRGAPLRLVLLLAAAIQLVPLAAPLVLSTDAWTYWGYGWIASDGGGNPYVDPPSAFPESPAASYVGEDWRETTTVYGPAFTLLSEPLALAARSSPDAAAWLFKSLAALGVLAATAAVAWGARRPALAVVLVGWNPVLAIQLAGGGHNDALVGGLAALGVALAVRNRASLSGVAWALAIFVKWIPLLFFAVGALAARARGRPTGLPAAALAGAGLALLATGLYGLDWLRALEPLAENAARETSYALPSRLEQLGLPDDVALAAAIGLFAGGLIWIARDARRGAARHGRAACLVLATTPYLAVWYLAWAVPLAAIDDDRVARLAALALTAYLLPQTIPL